MRRHSTAEMALTASGPARLVLSIAAQAPTAMLDEHLEVTQDGRPVEVTEIADPHGTRLHLLDVTEGDVRVSYRATVDGRADPLSVTPLDEVVYLRPSRYCESDSLAPTAIREFYGLSRTDLLFGVSSWVGERLQYVPGSSLPTDGAVQTLLAGEGVCRDYAHLVVALLRALNVPARLASVYAPGLSPMDFHAVAEAAIDGRWCVVDATTLAPRSSLVRIATGRDASDTAFLSIHGAATELDDLTVTAVVDVLPRDDVTELVSLG
ncbi:transglutaminase-like domain-containing protein [Microcella pacifica]|jgi:transglutaminase-like putative cysteine protease|uniref:Transglutaminase family protein n=1 Tax=Microcella pacifica TaxID=2591847 RepID=A0A9E5JLY9_9MICO|nr:transglutaminase family protein [Microcella pacifica]NHF63083.1 transglutaminase family protein [Microcella pacifica]